MCCTAGLSLSSSEGVDLPFYFAFPPKRLLETPRYLSIQMRTSRYSLVAFHVCREREGEVWLRCWVCFCLSSCLFFWSLVLCSCQRESRPLGRRHRLGERSLLSIPFGARSRPRSLSPMPTSGRFPRWIRGHRGVSWRRRTRS